MQPSVTSVFNQADELFPERYQPAQMARLIQLYEGLLADETALGAENQGIVLTHLSQLYYERATLLGSDHDDYRELIQQGFDYGLERLKLVSRFASTFEDDFETAIQHIDDPLALLWFGNNFGELLRFRATAALRDLPSLLLVYQRCLELDEAVWGGSCHNTLGATLALIPTAFGRDLEASKFHLDRAVELAPDYLMNHVVRADILGFRHNIIGSVVEVLDEDLVLEVETFVDNADIGDWPFWNRIAKRDIQALVNEL